MRAVVLHRLFSRCREIECVIGRSILRMHVMKYDQIVPADVIHRDKITNRFFERLQRFIVIEIADMLADVALAIHN